MQDRLCAPTAGGTEETLMKRGYAEYLGGTRIKFFFPDCSHTEIKDYSKGPRSKQMQETGCKMMASWWSKEKGGVSLGPCKKCKKE
jgi:hypothetical protein